MKIKIEKWNIDELLFSFAYGIWLFFTILSTSFYYRYYAGTIYQLIIFICIGILIIREFRFAHSYTLTTLWALIISIALIIIAGLADRSSIAYMICFIYCARNMSLEKIAKVSIWITGAAMILVILGSYTGIIQNYVITANGRTRQYLGFRYALHAPSYWFNIIALVFYLGREKVKWISIIILFAVNLWLYQMTNSRLTFFMSVLLLIVAIIIKWRPFILKKRKLLCTFMALSFIISFSLSMYLTINYDPGVVWQKELNTFLSGRLSYGKASLVNYGVTLFGQDLELIGNGLNMYGEVSTQPYNYVDNFYVQVLQVYGLLFMAVLLVLLTVVMYQCRRKNDYILLIILTFIAIHGIIDDLILYLHYNTFWFAIAASLTHNARDYLNNRLKTGKTVKEKEPSRIGYKTI